MSEVLLSYDQADFTHNSQWRAINQLPTTYTDTSVQFMLCAMPTERTINTVILLYPFNGFFSSTTWVSWHKGKPFWILLQQQMMGWQWHQLDHMQIICTSLQTDHHAMPVSHHWVYTALKATQWYEEQRSRDNWRAAFADGGRCVTTVRWQDADSAGEGIDQTRATDGQQSHCHHTAAHQGVTATPQHSSLLTHSSLTASRQCLQFSQHNN